MTGKCWNWRGVAARILASPAPALAVCMLQRYSACMKAVQIRSVPDETHRILRKRAAAAGMSLQEYLLVALKQMAARPTLEEVLARAGGRAGGSLRLSDAAKDVRADRDRR